MKILIKFPSRERPQKLIKMITKYVEKAEDMSNIRILVTLDEDDPTLTESVKEELIGIHPNITLDIGRSTGKIDAVNRGMPHPSTFDIVLLASDDMEPEVTGYDRIIRDRMKIHFPDTDGVLFFNDGFNKQKLNTLLICGSKYYRRFGYLYCPEYKSLFCDTEFMYMADFLRKQKYFDEVIIRHEHPHINPSVELDELYHRNNRYYFEDEATFDRRAKKIFMKTPTVINLPKVGIKLRM